MPECHPVATRAVSFGVADAPNRTTDQDGGSAATRTVERRGALAVADASKSEPGAEPVADGGVDDE
ncbi:hypothetical protein ACFO0N_07830 [Halobium salinum]|uniref:Uncharacterized protein n=1 Tax=Halobium salinum TaxID=1364940 RepID=A0ABD5PAN2_9EURY|nr:hypothetical protein [Halobium salinum]